MVQKAQKVQKKKLRVVRFAIDVNRGMTCGRVAKRSMTIDFKR